MSRRTFKFQETLATGGAGGVLDIPHTAVLKYATPAELKETFTSQWGVAPAAVCIPVVNPDGLLFPVDGLHEVFSEHSSNFAGGLNDFGDVIEVFSELALDIYLSIDPTLCFLDSDPLKLVDIAEDTSRQMCFGNPKTQDIAAAILGTGVDITKETTGKTKGKLKGVVLDIVDLWPMGGEKNHIELTCFCPSCTAFLEDVSPGIIRKYKTFPNPWNLLLQATETSITPITSLKSTHTPEDVIGLSRQKGFDKSFEDKSSANLLSKASDVLDYIRARHKQTILAMDRVFEEALRGLDDVPQRIIICEGQDYAWTSGIQIDALDKDVFQKEHTLLDEVWFDVRSSEAPLEKLEYRAYMASRSRYFVDAFFQFAANATNAEARANTGIARLSVAEVKEQLRVRLAQAMGTLSTGKTALSTLPPNQDQDNSAKRAGFVGVGLSREIGEKIIEGLSIAPGIANNAPSLSSILPEDFLSRMIAMRDLGDSDN